MPKSNSDLLWVYLKDTVYVATPSNDLTTMITRRITELTGDHSKAVISMILSAGGKN